MKEYVPFRSHGPCTEKYLDQIDGSFREVEVYDQRFLAISVWVYFLLPEIWLELRVGYL